jgi:hypothetical protein
MDIHCYYSFFIVFKDKGGRSSLSTGLFP